MTVLNLMNVPQTEPDFAAWSFANQDHHNRVTDFIQNSTGAPVTVRQVDPIALFDFQDWLQRHQQWHNDINAALGLAGFDLSDLDYKNKQQLEAWIRLHSQEHINWSTVSGVG